MKIGKLIIEFRRVGGATLAEEVFNAVTDPEGDARPVIAKMARSAAKDFIDAEGGRILADFTAELEKRKAAILAELGSASPFATRASDCPCCTNGCCGPHGENAVPATGLSPQAKAEAEAAVHRHFDLSRKLREQ